MITRDFVSLRVTVTVILSFFHWYACNFSLHYYFCSIVIHIYVHFSLFIANKTVDHASLNEILTKHAGLWRGVGFNLGLSYAVIENIAHDHPRQRRQFEETLHAWMKQDRDSATWGILELAITNANRAELSLGRLSKSKIVRLYVMHDFCR